MNKKWKFSKEECFCWPFNSRAYKLFSYKQDFLLMLWVKIHVLISLKGQNLISMSLLFGRKGENRYLNMWIICRRELGRNFLPKMYITKTRCMAHDLTCKTGFCVHLFLQCYFALFFSIDPLFQAGIVFSVDPCICQPQCLCLCYCSCWNALFSHLMNSVSILQVQLMVFLLHEAFLDHFISSGAPTSISFTVHITKIAAIWGFFFN